MSKKLRVNQIYSISPNFRIHKECEQCRCIMCANWRTDCRTCAICINEPHPFTRCKGFEPFIFSKEPYKSYIKELDSLREERKLYID